MIIRICGYLLAAVLLTSGTSWGQTAAEVTTPTLPGPSPTVVLTPGLAGPTGAGVLPAGAVSVPTTAVLLTPGPAGPTPTAILQPVNLPPGPHPTVLLAPGAAGPTPVGILPPAPGGPTPPVPSPSEAFEHLSPGNQKITQALFSAQVHPTPSLTPLTLDQIAALKATAGWGQVFHQMKSAGLLTSRNLGQVVSASSHAGASGANFASAGSRAPVVITNGAGRVVATSTGSTTGGRSAGGGRFASSGRSSTMTVSAAGITTATGATAGHGGVVTGGGHPSHGDGGAAHGGSESAHGGHGR